jgi:hypothetical protein
MLTLTDVLIPAADVITRESDGELVVVLPEQARFLVLNRTGASVLALVNGQQTLGQIARTLAERHEVSLERAETDVLTLAAKLLKRGIVQLAEPDGEK